MHLLARQVSLIDDIDWRLHLLKIHLPYHESDHVFDLAYNALCDRDGLSGLARFMRPSHASLTLAE
jgi:hypothetical protein